MILIIAEKPSLARNIVAGIGNLSKKSNYYEGMGYLVTWAFGHLFSLCDIEDYGEGPVPEGGKAIWNMDNIPCFPENFRFSLRKEKGAVDPGVVRQFETIRSLIQRQDVDTVVNAGDADREGEIIVRLCIQNAYGNRNGGGNLPECGKKFKRLWLPDQTPETVRAALAELKDESEYNLLANEGFARTYIDWLYGVNLTRYATLKTGRLLRVGRVIVPIVKTIYDRDMAIRYFVPEKYYGLQSQAETKGCQVTLTSKLKFSKDEEEKAKQTAARYNGEKAIVTAKKTKKDTVKPGKLYSLSKLQNVLGKKYKMPMDKSLEIVQKLYEAGYLTYPRTNSEYLATAEKDKIRSILANVKKLGYKVEFRDDKNIFDDSKIESHSAITPTYRIPEKDKLTQDEYLVYSTVMRRFAAVFCSEPCLAQKTEITVSVGKLEDFTLKGTVITQKGWMAYDDGQLTDKILPPLEKGDEIVTNFQPTEKETTPPKHYTIETLNNYLKNPFREEKAKAQEAAEGAKDESGREDSSEEGYGSDDAEEYRMILEGLELGTEATRTGIINNAITSKYIELKKDVYTILPDGEFLVEALMGMKISMDKHKTSEMGRMLKQIFHGKLDIRDGVNAACNEIRAVFAGAHAENVRPELDTEFGLVGDVVGKCPLCGGDFVRTRFGYGCSNYREGCKLTVNLMICRRPISKSNVRMLLETGKTSEIQGFTSKKGTQFNARLRRDGDKVVFDFPAR